jgi:hypothetical protein
LHHQGVALPLILCMKNATMLPFHSTKARLRVAV